MKTKHKLIMIFLLFFLASVTFADKLHDKKSRCTPTKVHFKKHQKKTLTKKHYRPNIENAETSAYLVNHSQPLDPPNNSSFKKLVYFVKESIFTLRYSVYRLGGGLVDMTKGLYILDCSRYVDWLLKFVYPNPYHRLVNATGSDNPNSKDYYNFFTQLSYRPQPNWQKITEVNQMEPGDILVVRYRNNKGKETGGHVMVVMDKPLPSREGYLVNVADSAAAPHSEDTRPRHSSGIGMGYLLLKTNLMTGEPNALAWKVGAAWQHNIKVAMARPIDSANSPILSQSRPRQYIMYPSYSGNYWG